MTRFPAGADAPDLTDPFFDGGGCPVGASPTAAEATTLDLQLTTTRVVALQDGRPVTAVMHRSGHLNGTVIPRDNRRGTAGLDSSYG